MADEIPAEALQAAAAHAKLRQVLIEAELASEVYRADDGHLSVGIHTNEEAADRALAVLAEWTPYLIAEGRRQAAAEIRMADPGLGWSVLSPERAARIAEGKVDQ